MRNLIINVQRDKFNSTLICGSVALGRIELDRAHHINTRQPYEDKGWHYLKLSPYSGEKQD